MSTEWSLSNIFQYLKSVFDIFFVVINDRRHNISPMNISPRTVWTALLLTTTALLWTAGCASQRGTSESRRVTTLDLTAQYDLRADESSQFGAWEVVPKGKQIFDGTQFDVGGMIRLYGTRPPPHGTVYRDSVVGIKIDRKFDKLHLLHGTGWWGTDGMPVARMVWHYADGTQHSFRIVYGRHVRDWWCRGDADDVADADSKVVWKGQAPNATVRLYRTTFYNPEPKKKVSTLDLISEKSLVTPAVVAITVEGR